MMDGVRQANQFYPDIPAHDRVFDTNPEAFKIGFYGYLHKRSWVGWNDPIAWYYVSDGLCRASAGFSITPNDLSNWLNREYKATWFTPQVTGRIMSGIHRMVYEAFRAHGPVGVLPFERYDVSERRSYYCLDGPESVRQHGQDVGRILMMGLRRRLLLVVRANMDKERAGKFPVYPDIEGRMTLDPEDMQWKEVKGRLGLGPPPAPRSHKRS